MEKLERKKFGIEASFKGVDEKGNFVCIPVKREGFYLNEVFSELALEPQKSYPGLVFTNEWKEEKKDENTIYLKFYFK